MHTSLKSFLASAVAVGALAATSASAQQFQAAANLYAKAMTLMKTAIGH